MASGTGPMAVYTEFIPSDGLIRDASKALAKLNIFDYERPVGIQLYGPRDRTDGRGRAHLAEAAGPDLIDTNSGRPGAQDRRGAGQAAAG
ncbi:MAG: hypothetical protein ACLR8Y_00075 [Alistipes indistinctus]